jgi:hypothetical protein
MKKLFFASAFATVFVLSFSSCSKCETCTKSGGSEVRLCEKDYDSNTAYGFAIDVYENDGYNCR